MTVFNLHHNVKDIQWGCALYKESAGGAGERAGARGVLPQGSGNVKVLHGPGCVS